MTLPLVINGVTFQYPEQNDTDWGSTATSWASAVTSGMLQKSGGTFTLLAETNFGSNYGLKSLYYKSTAANIALAGAFRLAALDTINFRNNANDADLPLGLNISDRLTFASQQLALSSELQAHLDDTSSAHAASAIANTPSGNLTSTDAQSALNELQSDIDTRATSTELSNHINDTTDAHAASAIANTPSGNLVATDTQAALNELQSDIDTINNKVGAANGICPLGSDTKISSTYLPSYVDDVIEVANFASLPITGETGKIYVTLDDNLTYRWSGSAYVEISKSLALGTTSTTAFRGDYGNTAYNHSQATGVVHGLSGSIVGTSDSQILTNKDIDGGVASNTSRLTIPQGTLSNLNSLTRKEGTVVYATDTDKIYYDDGASLTAVGSGSGSGELSTYAQLKSDDDSSTWTSGNNAAFLGGGSVAGAFNSKNSSSPLNGSYSYTFVQAAGSLNDYIASGVIAIPNRAKNSASTATNLVRFPYTYDGNTNDIQVVVYDVTNSAVLTSLSQTIQANAEPYKKNEFFFELPYTCTQIRFGFKVLVANNGKTLKFDDVEFTSDPFKSVTTIEQESVTYIGYTSKDGSNKIKLSGKSGRSDNSMLLSDTNTSWTQINVLKKIKYTAVFNINFVTAGIYNTIMYHYDKTGAVVRKTSYLSGTNIISTPTVLTGDALEGDYFIIVTDGGALVNDGSTNFSITATATTQNIIQQWTDGTEWKSETYTTVNGWTGNQGLGTFTAGSVEWKRDGGDLLYKGKLTVGTTVASEARIPLPFGLMSADTTKIPTIRTFGIHYRGGVSASDKGGSVLVSPSVGYFNLGSSLTFGTNTTTTDSVANGNTTFASGNILYFEARIPIQGWSSSPSLVALPNGAENRYYIEATSNSGQSASPTQDIYYTGSITNSNMIWDGSGLVAPMDGDYEFAGMVNPSTTVTGGIGAYVNGSLVKICCWYQSSTSELSFSGKINLVQGQRLSFRPTASFAVAANTQYHWLSITKIHGRIDKTFVGNVPLDWQYDLTVTGSNWTTTRAVGVVYKTGNGSYRIKGNISGTMTASISKSIDISGVIFKNAATYQPVTGYIEETGISPRVIYTCVANKNSSSITIQSQSGNITAAFLSFDVELESKPTFAVNTP